MHVVPHPPATLPPVPDVKGVWLPGMESCFIIRASPEFLDANIEADNGMYLAMKETSGRYFRVEVPGWEHHLMRQEVSDGEHNHKELWLWKDGNSSPGWFVGDHPTTDKPILWLPGNPECDVAPGGKAYFPHYASKKKVKWTQDRWVP